MARTINSPGLQITETDLSENTQLSIGTNIFVTGFAAQGPTDEVLSITSASELELIYGQPTTAAERYFYNTCKEVLNSPGTLLTTRLPYGSGSGEGFTTNYGVLFYPAVSTAQGFALGTPTLSSVNSDTYNKLIQGNFTWGTITSATSAFAHNGSASYNALSSIANAGLIVINTSQTTVNQNYEGYYIGISDNTAFGPEQPFNSVGQIYGLSNNGSFEAIPDTVKGFTLSAAQALAGTNSVSEIIEGVPTYNFGDEYYKDSVVFTLFKVRKSIYEPDLLTISLNEAYAGSFDPNKKTAANAGGIARTFFIEDIVNKSSANVKLLINPLISQSTNWVSPSSINPAKSITTTGSSKALYTTGVYTPTYTQTTKHIGNIPGKLDRVLALIDSSEKVNIDVIPDAGLSTIHAITQGGQVFNDNDFIDSTNFNDENNAIFTNWRTIYNTFNNFVQNTRKDCVFISDPIRHIFVNGENTKRINLKGASFTSTIYSPLKKLYGTANSNYSVTYGNWIQVYDTFIDRPVWTPPSGHVAAAYARTDFIAHPWIAPAGLTRGILTNILDLGFNPNQKQRDFLYTININPIVFFPNDGFVIFGQKTLQKRPSAFDRVNVRRLFLALEKAVSNSLKYYIFEPNTEFTRTRIINTLDPIFENAKNTEGLYDYLLVCDERNNTPATIDNNELNLDIYIKPTRAAEFILVNFIATRTGQNFEELI